MFSETAFVHPLHMLVFVKETKFHHTNQQSGSALVRGSEQAENQFNYTFCGYDLSLPKTFTSTFATITAPQVRFDKNVYYIIPSSNRPTSLYVFIILNITSLSSTYVSSSVINNALT